MSVNAIGCVDFLDEFIDLSPGLEAELVLSERSVTFVLLGHPNSEVNFLVRGICCIDAGSTEKS